MPAKIAQAPVPATASEARRRNNGRLLAAGLFLAAAACAAYSRTFSVPALYDDDPSIADNPSIRHLATAFWPPSYATVGGRPILNLSLAINYAISGTQLWRAGASNDWVAAWNALIARITGSDAVFVNNVAARMTARIIVMMFVLSKIGRRE